MEYLIAGYLVVAAGIAWAACTTSQSGPLRAPLSAIVGLLWPVLLLVVGCVVVQAVIADLWDRPAKGGRE